MAYLAFHNFTSKFYEFTRQGHLNQLNQQQPTFAGATNTNMVTSELVSVFSTINVKRFVNKMYMSPEQPIDMRRLRPLYYQPSDLVLWKSYFGRYHWELRPTLECTEGPLSATYAYESLKNSSKVAAKALH